MKKQNFWSRVGSFMTGRGFYMVLVLCLVAIGLSGWYLWSAFQTASNLDAATANSSAEVTLAEESDLSEDTSDADTSADASSAADSSDTSDGADASEGDAEVIGTPVTEEEEPTIAQAEIPSEANLQSESEPVTAETTQWVRPVDGEVAAAFSRDELTYNEAMGDWRIHEGVDLSAGIGDDVVAACSGTVTQVEEDYLLGWTVTVDCGNGLTTVYGNLAEDCAVSAGDEISAGDTIGAVGDTAAGESSGTAWLHFAVQQDGEAVDPMNYLAS